MTTAEAAPMARKKLSQATRGGMGKNKRPVTLPAPTWDHGAKGPANRIGLIEEPATDIDPQTGRETSNPNSVTRMRRRAWVDTYLLQGKLTVAQAETARELRRASEGNATQDPLAALGISTDKDTRAPEPQANAFDARRKFHKMWRHVPAYARPIIEHVVVDDRPVTAITGGTKGGAAERHLDRLRRGLDTLREGWNRRA